MLKGEGANRILRTENFKNPVADYQHKNYLAPPPPRLESTTPIRDHAQRRQRPVRQKFLTEVRKILDPPLVEGDLRGIPRQLFSRRIVQH